MKNDDLWQLDGEPGPALPVSDDDLRRLVSGAVARAHGPSEPAAESRSVFTGKHLLAGIGVAACVVATWAMYGTGAKHTDAAASIAESTPAAPATVASSAPSPAIADRVPSIDVQALPAAQPIHPSPETSRTMSRLPSEAPRDLLREANRLRAERRWNEAASLYRRVADARSEESTTAMLALASLRLEHQNDAAEARRLYGAVLAASPDGPLSEEARLGTAMACRALGDVQGERAALTTFLAHHPSSLSASKAQARLSELDAMKQVTP